MAYEYHDCANIFPMLSGKDLDELAADIKVNGVKEPGTLYQGKILDGRNRFKACEIAGIEMWWEELDEGDGFDPLTFVVAKNLHRRHLSTGQRGMCAARVKDYYAKQAKERKSTGGKRGREKQLGGDVETLPDAQRARDAAGKAFGVSGKQVDKSSKVLKQGATELVAAVDSNSISVDAAVKLIAAVPDKREQARVVKEGPKAVAAKIKEGKPDKKRRSKKVASGGAEPVTSGPLAGMEPDSAGVPLKTKELDRVKWTVERFNWLWEKYQATFGDEANWMFFSMAWEKFALEHEAVTD